MGNYAEEMQRIDVAGIICQHAAIKRLRFRQPAGPMVFQGCPQQLAHLRIIAPCPPEAP